MAEIAIIDYGLCNLDSITRAVERCGAQPLVTDDPDDLERADRLILPGVGAFGAAMQNLRQRGLDIGIRRQVEAGIPLLGICLGMQLLATEGEENGRHGGLDLIPGKVVHMQPAASEERLPHIGWNTVVPAVQHHLFDGLPEKADFYFVHSYSLLCDDPADVVATTPFCGGFNSVVQRGRVMGTQFHPEKSQKTGFRLLRNFLAL